MPKAKAANGSVPTNRIANLTESRDLVISRANLVTAEFLIIGDSPYCQHKFSKKATQQMMDKMKAGGTAKKSTKKEPRDFDRDYVEAMYQPNPPWPNGGIPANALLASMVDACRLTDFQMRSAKQCIDVLADGFDVDTMKPLIRITKGAPEPFITPMRIQMTTDIRVRPLWQPGWEAIVRIQYDADRFTMIDVANLLHRAGSQVGIGEGRPQSKMCVGLGWGKFHIDG